MAYQLKTDYFDSVPVSPDDLNKRGQILQTQLPGAIDALGIGVLHAGDFLASQNADGADIVTAGGAVIRSDDGTPVIVRVTEPLPIPPRGDGVYLHLVLRVPQFDDSAGTNSLRGAAPVLQVSEDEEEPDALLLAMWDGTQWVDRRPLSQLAQLQTLLSDVGYDADARQLGSINARLSALEGSGDDDQTGGLLAQFNAYKTKQDAINADLTTRIKALEKLSGVATTGNTRDLDKYSIRDVQRLEIGLTRLDALFSLIADGSIHIPGFVGDNQQLGDGVFARDVHSGNTEIDEEKGEEN